MLFSHAEESANRQQLLSQWLNVNFFLSKSSVLYHMKLFSVFIFVKCNILTRQKYIALSQIVAFSRKFVVKNANCKTQHITRLHLSSCKLPRVTLDLASLNLKLVIPGQSLTRVKIFCSLENGNGNFTEQNTGTNTEQ